jgi:hypothetical protein
MKNAFLRFLAADLPYAAGSLTLLVWRSMWTSQRTGNRFSGSSHPQSMMNSPWKDFACRQVAMPALIRLCFELIDGLALEHLFKQIQMLSSGTRRKVWIAAAFASGAALTLLDDPRQLDKSICVVCIMPDGSLGAGWAARTGGGGLSGTSECAAGGKIDLGDDRRLSLVACLIGRRRCCVTGLIYASLNGRKCPRQFSPVELLLRVGLKAPRF